MDEKQFEIMVKSLEKIEREIWNNHVSFAILGFTIMILLILLR